WAAKRFWNVGDGDHLVSPNQNQSEIVNEVIRLCQLGQLLSAFMDQAKESQVSISTGELLYISIMLNGPSPASGIGDLVYAGLDPTKQYITWLLEPMRPKALATTKWSGTMQHPSHNSKVGDTLTTFVHFTYQWTYKTLVFADLQSESGGVTGSGDYVLFDVMTHTLAGQSGVGDHGLEGIQKFCDMHACSNKCKNLGLSPISQTLAAENSDCNDSDNDSDSQNKTSL
ncbi:kinase-like domain-containing protein, partial [Lentinula boryana]